MQLFELRLFRYELAEVGDGLSVVGPPGLVVTEVEVFQRCDIARIDGLQKLFSLLLAAQAT